MKLLMIGGDRSILQGKRGAFWYTLQELRKHWDRIDVLCPRSRGRQQEMQQQRNEVQHEAAQEGGDVYFHPNPCGLWLQPWWVYKRGAQLFEQQQFDVMTVHEYPPFYNGIGAQWLHRRIGVPYAMEIHHIVGYPMATSLTERVGRMLSRLYLATDARSASAVRTVNGTVLDTLVSWGMPPDKLSIVPSFYLDRKLITSTPAPPVAYDLAVCGRLVANKGLPEVVRALAYIPDGRMIIIGDGPLRTALERQVKELHLEGRVVFTGWLPTQEAVIEAMKSARIFVMNSKSEGGPRVLLEAMASGLPVIATPVGIAPDVVQDGVNGYITTGTPEDLHQLIQPLLTNEDARLAMGQAAAGVLDRYDRATLIAGYANFLKSLARSQP